MPGSRIQQIEDYVKSVMAGGFAHDLKIAHDFKHVDRVRHWALQIARREGFRDFEMIEAVALLHDIGLSATQERNQHAQVGAEMAAKFLRERELFAEEEIEEIVDAIRHHSSLSGEGKLLEILRDADILDLFGAIGIMRAFTSKYSKPEYDPYNIRGSTWGMSARDFDQRFTERIGIGDYIIDQVNFQISCYSNLRTETAKQFANPLVEFMKAYIVQLDFEINAGRDDLQHNR